MGLVTLTQSSFFPQKVTNERNFPSRDRFPVAWLTGKEPCLEWISTSFQKKKTAGNVVSPAWSVNSKKENGEFDQILVNQFTWCPKKEFELILVRKRKMLIRKKLASSVMFERLWIFVFLQTRRIWDFGKFRRGADSSSRLSNIEKPNSAWLNGGKSEREERKNALQQKIFYRHTFDIGTKCQSKNKRNSVWTHRSYGG